MNNRDFDLFLVGDDYTHKDVLYNGKFHCTVEYQGKWFIMPINFKFEAKLPYLGASDAVEITKEEVDQLPHFDLLLIERMKKTAKRMIDNNPPIYPVRARWLALQFLQFIDNLTIKSD